MQGGQIGRFFGISEHFTGMAVVIDANPEPVGKDGKPEEPTGRHRDVTIVANNGTRSHADLIGSMEGCAANVGFEGGGDDFNVGQVRTRKREGLHGERDRKHGKRGGDA